MNEIEVGEYVRSKDGYIGRVKDIICKGYPIRALEGYIVLDDENGTILNPEEVKYSFNIKELIDENDIVEYKINSLSELKVGRVKNYRDARNNKQYLGIEGFDITKIYIISILTETKYKQECYVVEEEKDE